MSSDAINSQVRNSPAVTHSLDSHGSANGLQNFDFTDSYNSFPLPAPYAQQRVIHGIAIGLLVGGCVGLAATAAAAVWLIGTPLFIITSVSVGAVVSIAMLIAGIVLKLKKFEFWQDPNYRRQIAVEMVETVQAEQLSFRGLQTRFSSAMVQGILSDNQLNQLYREDITQLSYSDFIQRHGFDLLGRLTLQHREEMHAKFLLFVANSDLAIREIRQQHRDAIAILGITTDELIDHALFQQIDDLQSRDLTYRQFQQNNGHEAVAGFIRINEGVQPLIREAFLNMGWQDMTDVDFAADRRLLDIEEEHIHASVRRDNGLEYFAFKRKHGLAPLLQGVIAREEYPDAWEEEVLAHLSTQPASTVMEHTPDLHMFGIDSHQFLLQRWRRTPLAEIFSSDRREFTAIYLASAEGRDDATTRILQEADDSGWSIQQLLQFRELWGRNLLTPLTQFSDGSTIQQRFDREIQTIGALEMLLEAYGGIAFENGLFSSPVVQRLVVQVHRTHPLQPLPRNIEQILQRFPTLVPGALLRLLQDGQRQQAAVTGAFESFSEECERNLRDSHAALSAQHETRKAEIAMALRPQVEECRAMRNRCQELLREKVARVARISHYRSQLSQPQRMAALQQRISRGQSSHIVHVREVSARMVGLEELCRHAEVLHAALSAASVQGFAAAAQQRNRIQEVQQEINTHRSHIQSLQSSLRASESSVVGLQMQLEAMQRSSGLSNSEQQHLAALVSSEEAFLRPILYESEALERSLAIEQRRLQSTERSQLKAAKKVFVQAHQAEERVCHSAIRRADERRLSQEQQLREAFIRHLDALV